MNQEPPATSAAAFSSLIVAAATDEHHEPAFWAPLARALTLLALCGLLLGIGPFLLAWLADVSLGYAALFHAVLVATLGVVAFRTAHQ